MYLSPISYIIPQRNTPIDSPKNLIIWHIFEKLNWYLFSSLFIYTASQIFSYAVDIKIDQDIAIIIINKLFPSTMNNKNLYKLGIITMIGITIHNIPEGIATFITTNENIKLGISITIAITMHNIPEDCSPHVSW